MALLCSWRCDKIVDLVDKGVPFEKATEAAGVGRRCAEMWKKKGREDIEAGNNTTLEAIFAQGLIDVETKDIAHNYAIVKTADKGWQANAWCLERRWYKYFSQRAEVTALNERMDNIEINKVKDNLDEKELDQGRS